MNNNKEINRPTEKEIHKALAVLIKNTRTTKRYISIVEIADWLDIAVRGLGGFREVAERLGLSLKMIKQFTYIKKLVIDVQDMFDKREIDSVDIAVHLSMLNNDEQLLVAKEVAAKQLDSADVRAVRELRKDAPTFNIKHIIEKVTSSKNIKHYIAEFVVRSKTLDEEQLIEYFSKVIKSRNIFKLIKRGSIGHITMNSAGKQLLQEYAIKHGLTKAQAVSLIAKGDIH